MKKVLLGMTAALMLVSACKKEDNKPAPPNENPGNNNPPVSTEIVVPQVNMSMVNKLTGSLCGPCGTWGWQAFETIINENDSDAFYMGTYSQNFVAQLFITQVATDMDAMFKNAGYPTFTANGVPMLDRGDTYLNSENEVAKVKAAVDKHATSQVYVNSGFRDSVAGDSMYIFTRTKFFNDVGGDLYLAVYLMEDKVKGYQASHPDGSNTLHHQVLRAAGRLDGAAKAESFGYKINTDNYTEAGTDLNNRFAFNIAGYDKNNLSVAVVVWRKVSIRYQFINAYSNQHRIH